MTEWVYHFQQDRVEFVLHGGGEQQPSDRKINQKFHWQRPAHSLLPLPGDAMEVIGNLHDGESPSYFYLSGYLELSGQTHQLRATLQASPDALLNTDAPTPVLSSF